MPSECVSTVKVRYPHTRHGNSGKVSHATNNDAKSDFLTFVDINSQPNGRSVANYDERVQQSLVGEKRRVTTLLPQAEE